MSQLQASPEPGIWYVFDHSKRIAIIRHVEIRGRRLLRSVTFDWVCQGIWDPPGQSKPDPRAAFTGAGELRESSASWS